MSIQPVHCVHNQLNASCVDLDGKWGMRIESALVVRRVKTKGEFNGDIWLGFERLTCVPIQTKMVKENMLTKDEKGWLKVRTYRVILFVISLIDSTLGA